MFEILLYNVVLARVDSIRAVSLIIDSRARKLGVDPDIFETRYGEDWPEVVNAALDKFTGEEDD